MAEFFINNSEIIYTVLGAIFGWLSEFVRQKAKKPGKDFWDFANDLLNRVDKVQRDVDDVKNKK